MGACDLELSKREDKNKIVKLKQYILLCETGV